MLYEVITPLLALLLLIASSSWAMSLEEAQTALSGRDFQRNNFV